MGEGEGGGKEGVVGCSEVVRMSFPRAPPHDHDPLRTPPGRKSMVRTHSHLITVTSSVTLTLSSCLLVSVQGLCSPDDPSVQDEPPSTAV